MTEASQNGLTERLDSMLTDPQLEIADDLRRILVGLQKIQHYSKGEHIYKEGQPCHGVYIVHTGSIKLMIDGFSPDQCQDCSVRKDMVLGLASALGAQSHAASAVCQTECEVGFIPLKSLFGVLKNKPTLSLDLSMKIAAGIARAHEQVVKMRTTPH